MISEKRSRKPPESFEILERKLAQKEKKVEKKRKVTGSDFELIPVPQKYEEDSDSFFLIYGVSYLFCIVYIDHFCYWKCLIFQKNLPIMFKDGEFGSNLSMLDNFHLHRGVHTAEFEGQKLVAVQTERRPDKRFPRWYFVLFFVNYK